MRYPGKRSRGVVDRFTRFFSLALLMVLPFGYYPDYPDSSQFEIGVGGGFGQVASITRSCSGGIISKEENTYSDFAASGFGRMKLSEESDFVYGAQLGYFRATSRFADYSPVEIQGTADRWYFGPRIAIEGRIFGAGIGFVANKVPYRFEYDSDWEKSEVGLSGHVRIGSTRGIYFLSSLSENSPLIAGGGHFDIGFGFPLGGRTRLYSALSCLPYDGPGYLQQVDISLSKKMALNLAGRAGNSAGIFEGALAASLVFRIGEVKSQSTSR